MSGTIVPEEFCEFCDAAIEGMEWPDEYNKAQLGGERVILKKSDINSRYNTGTMPCCLYEAGLNLRIINININKL